MYRHIDLSWNLFVLYFGDKTIQKSPFQRVPGHHMIPLQGSRFLLPCQSFFPSVQSSDLAPKNQQNAEFPFGYWIVINPIYWGFIYPFSGFPTLKVGFSNPAPPGIYKDHLKPIISGINYTPQLVSRISSISILYRNFVSIPQVGAPHSSTSPFVCDSPDGVFGRKPKDLDEAGALERIACERYWERARFNHCISQQGFQASEVHRSTSYRSHGMTSQFL